MGWEAVARAQDGVIATRQLVACGLSRDKVRALTDSAALVPVRRGVHLVRGAPLTYAARLWAAVLATEGVLGFATGAHLWGMEQEPDQIEVIVARNRHLWRNDEVRTHRIDLRPWAVTVRNGLPVTTRRETALDHIGRLPSGPATTFTDRAMQQGWLLPRDLEDRVRRQPGRVGNRRLRLLAASVGDGAAAQSERVLHRLLRSAGISGWEPNLDVWVDGQLVAVLDVAFRHALLAIEVDGWAFHSDAERFQRDRSRQNHLVALGWTVLRFTWRDLTERPGYVLAAIRRALADRGSFAG